MNSKLKALLAAGSVVVIVAGIATLPHVIKSGASKAELVDAGIKADCNFRRIACAAYVDGGYQEREFTIAVCPPGDGGALQTIWPRKAAALRDYLLDENTGCRVIANPTDVDITEDPPERTGSCACHNPAAGPCSDDAGRIAAHNEALPGTWVGAGCRPKICGEFLGLYNWPVECPQ